jgi:hypothetical protein
MSWRRAPVCDSCRPLGSRRRNQPGDKCVHSCRAWTTSSDQAEPLSSSSQTTSTMDRRVVVSPKTSGQGQQSCRSPSDCGRRRTSADNNDWRRSLRSVACAKTQGTARRRGILFRNEPGSLDQQQQGTRKTQESSQLETKETKRSHLLEWGFSMNGLLEMRLVATSQILAPS